jgi:hypothetical protein
MNYCLGSGGITASWLKKAVLKAAQVVAAAAALAVALALVVIMEVLARDREEIMATRAALEMARVRAVRSQAQAQVLAETVEQEQEKPQSTGRR